MKRWAVAAAVAAINVTPVLAADYVPRIYRKAAVAPVSPAYDWSGFYAGVNGGYGWSGRTGNRDGFAPAEAAAVAAGVYPETFGTRRSGFTGGGQVGYNIQSGRFVYGIETDIQGGDLKNTRNTFYPGPAFAPVVNTATDRMPWYGTTRLRAGVTMTPNVLLFATGGVAYGEVGDTTTTFGTNANYSGSTSDTRVGYAVGGGADWRLSRNWSLRGEYLYVDLGDTTVRQTDPVNFPGQFVDFRFRHDLHVARGALNYHF